MDLHHNRFKMGDAIHSLRLFINRFWDYNYLYAVGIKILTVVQFMVLVKIVSISLSLADAGNFFLMYNAALMVSALFFSTHSSAFLRFYSMASDKLSLYKTVIGQLSIAISILIAIMIMLYGYFRKEFIQYPLSFAYAVSIGILLMLTTKFRVAGQFRQLFYVTLSQNILLAGLTIVCLLFLDLSLELIIVCMAISAISPCIFYAAIKHASLRQVLQRASDKRTGRALFLYGFPFVLLALSNTAISTNGQFMLKYLGYSDEVGVYAANYNIGEKSVFLWLSLVLMVNIPKFYHAHENFGRSAGWQIIKNCMIILGVFGGIMVVVMSIWSRYLSALFSSDEISELGHWIVPGTVVSAVLLGFCSLLAELILVDKRSLTVTLCYVASALISIILNYLLISAYGLVGAVASAITGNILLLFMLWTCIKKVRDC